MGGLARARLGGRRLGPLRHRIEYRLDRRGAREMVDLFGTRRPARYQCAALLRSVRIVPGDLYNRNFGNWTPSKNVYPIFLVHLSASGDRSVLMEGNYAKTVRHPPAILALGTTSSGRVTVRRQSRAALTFPGPLVSSALFSVALVQPYRLPYFPW